MYIGENYFNNPACNIVNPIEKDYAIKGSVWFVDNPCLQQYNYSGAKYLIVF